MLIVKRGSRFARRGASLPSVSFIIVASLPRRLAFGVRIGPKEPSERQTPSTERLITGQGLQLFEQPPLPVANPARQHRVDTYDKVAASIRAEAGHAQPSQAEAASVGGCRRHLHAHRATERGHVDLTAQHQSSERHVEVDQQVVLLAPKERVRLDVDVKIQVTLGATHDAGAALARDADAGPIAHAGRELDLDVARVGDQATAGAGRAGTSRGRTARAVAALAMLFALNAEDARAAVEGLLQGHGDLLLQVAAPARPRPPGVGGIEDALEEVEGGLTRPRPAVVGGASHATRPVHGPEHVVAAAFLR